MFYIVESEKSLQHLESLGKGGCFLEIVQANDNFHPKLSKLVAVYIRPLEGDPVVNVNSGEISGSVEKGYIIPICHDEGLNVSFDRVKLVLKHFSKIYVRNKKQVLYYFNVGPECIDLNLKQVMLHYSTMNIVVREKTCDWFYNRYGGSENLNQIIPLPKLYERCENIFGQVQKYLTEEPEPEGFNFYNEIATKAFFLVEQNGIRIDKHNFIERFKPLNADFSIEGETVYTSYNLYNITSRPTNSFNSVNFLAIPKGVEFRRCFKPQNSKFYEFDYDGFHCRIVSELINYPLSVNIKAHKQLASLRTGKVASEITGEEYVAAKSANFKMIYGTPSESDRKLEFSQKIQEYVEKLWKQYKKEGKVSNLESGKVFSKELSDMYNSKLFNYMIQSLETSKNIVSLYEVLRYLNKRGARSKIVLVTYDAFLLDYAESDGPEIIQGIKGIMEKRNHEGNTVFPVEIKESLDLNFD